ncbi:hypothetical protein LWT56_22330 [Enterobacter roggenkampii]|uniref:hypothetical protein n=1 Tax=Enterobacter roggenkampii TaxID=1812935 RepID=UPI001E32926B|nr:hypothetical protein [Enterobacter roggenkampii]MCE1977407.1 hypothetical protein [Enterobacter roggenkampii]
MPNYALVKNGLVQNIFVCDNDQNAHDLFPDDTVVNVDGVFVGIGWNYEDGAFTNPDAPPSPTQAELYEAELALINAEYEADKQSLANEYLNAGLFDGSNEGAKKTSIYNRLIARNQRYSSDLEALDEKYGG